MGIGSNVNSNHLIAAAHDHSNVTISVPSLTNNRHNNVGEEDAIKKQQKNKIPRRRWGRCMEEVNNVSSCICVSGMRKPFV